MNRALRTTGPVALLTAALGGYGCDHGLPPSTLASQGGAAEAAGDGPVILAITRAADDDSDETVGAVVAGGHEVCSGTLIGARVVLTAGHCAAGAQEVRFETAGVARAVPVVDRTIHPRFDPQTLAHDLALLFLADAALERPLPLRAAPLGASEVGRTVRLVGLGHATPAGTDPHRRREGTAVVSGVGVHELTVAPQPSLPCLGDSGGPVLLRGAHGEEEIAAVVSSGDERCARVARAQRVDGEAGQFIAAGLGALRDEDTTTGCAIGRRDRAASPTEALILAAAVLLLLLLRRARRQIHQPFETITRREP